LQRARGRLRVTAVLAGLASLAACALLFFGLRGLLMAAEQAEWDSVQARILSVESARYRYHVDGPHPGDRLGTRITVKYRYTVGGRSYTSSRYRLTEPHDDWAEGREDEAAARLAELKSASTLTVHVPPGDPTGAVIDTEEVAPAVVVTALGSVILVGALGFLVAAKFAVRRAARARS
jgi:hypothetical protein